MVHGTGILRTTGDGLELLLVREFAAAPTEIWAWVTESERLAAWIGTWTGQAGVGNVVTFTMNAEPSAEPEQVTIIDCDPPKRVQAEFSSEAGTWQLQLDVRPHGDGCVFEFSQLIEQGDDVTAVGPGWEYYLDRLVAAHAGAPLPAFEDYYPALVDYYSDLGA